MYKQDSLPFLYSDLEPYIDTHTMGLHYNKHQKNYLKNLNRLLVKNNYNFSYKIEELYKHIEICKPEDRVDILFNLGGVVNHNLYWKCIDKKDREDPKGLLLEKIITKFESLDQFKEKFIQYALSLKGSGYTFLIQKQDGSIDIINTKDQDSPLLYNYTPLFNVDMWEHAYYLNYQNNKKEYLDNFFDIANFKYANEKIEEKTY